MSTSSAAKHTPSQFRGFLANGDWLIAVHSKRCAKQRRRVTSGERARSMVPNRQCQFSVAMRARAEAGSAA